MEENLNYLGAAIFWLYIVAALFFSGLVIYTIVTLPDPRHVDQSNNTRDVAIFTALASISFATLSYNMLNVLIHSYLNWYQTPFEVRNLVVGDVWRWSVTSTLFHDFAAALVGTYPRLYWLQAALIATISVCLFMGSEGHRRRVPRLWAFFCLAQILPISFTQNLFYITLLRLPDESKKLGVPRQPISILLTVYAISIGSAYIAPKWLLPIIFSTRLALFAPLFLCKPRSQNRAANGEYIDGAGMQRMLTVMAFQLLAPASYAFFKYNLTARDIRDALSSHPAVSSLGCDFVICVLSYRVWKLRTASNKALPNSTHAT